jgi:hypothetical protein
VEGENMNNNENQSEKLWAFVHQELTEADRVKLAEDVEATPTLKSELAAIRAVDRQLKVLMPMVDMTEEDLEKKVLGAWEAECGQGSQSSSVPGTIIYPEFQKNRWAFSARKATRVVLAMAACLLIAVGVRNYTSESIQWLTPEYQSALQYRSADGAPAQSFYSNRDLQDFSSALRTAIKKNYRGQKTGLTPSLFHKSTDWIMISKWQELREKSLYVQLEAYEPQHRALVKEWSQQFDNSEAFYAELDSFSTQIARELAELAPQDSQ